MSWWINDTSTYVEFVDYYKGDKLYKLKDNYIDENSVGFLLYAISDKELVAFCRIIADNIVKIPLMGKEIKHNTKAFLHYSDYPVDSIKPVNLKEVRYAMIEIESWSSQYERDNTKMYYYEFPGSTTATEREEYIDAIAKNWNFEY